MSKVRDILGVDKESEFLQSFVRVGLTADQEDNEPHKSLYMQTKAPPIVKQSSEIRSEGSGGRSPTRTRTSPGRGGGENGRARRTRRREYFEEMYTDKDRAAAVSYGCYHFMLNIPFFFSFILICHLYNVKSIWSHPWNNKILM